MRLPRKKGFSLIELMVVILIIGLLATIVVVNVTPFLQRAYEEKVRADFSQISQALTLYRLNERRYPNTQEGLQALISPSEQLTRPQLFPDDGYISRLPIDPWDRPYQYQSPGEHDNDYDLFTLGADGIEGGTGENRDIGNWMQ